MAKSVKLISYYLLLVVVVAEFCTLLALAGLPVNFLPGFQGPLPFELETGYVGVGDNEEVQLFYYFIKSESNPETDPLLLWITGGPGCSALSGILYEIGPISFEAVEYNGSFPTLILNLYSWTKVASIIFLDLPVGTGFSYATTPTALQSSDLQASDHAYHFLRKWFIDHPEFLKNPLYIAGDSYSGRIVPIITQIVATDNEIETEPSFNLKGYILGNPLTFDGEMNYEIPFAHGHALISDELYESLKRNCDGEYLNIDPSNTQCLQDVDTFHELLKRIYKDQILEPSCPDERIIEKFHHLNNPQQLPALKCRGYLLRNPGTFEGEGNYEIPFAYGMGLISDELYESLKRNCKGEYVNIDPSNAQCLQDVETFHGLLERIYSAQILEPYCERVLFGQRRYLDEKFQLLNNSQLLPALKCIEDWYVHSYHWANNDQAREALHIRKGTTGEWVRCATLQFQRTVKSSIPYHANLSVKGYRSLIYSGDHDKVVPFQSTQAWIKSLNYSIASDWRPWTVDDQVAGYTRTYSNDMTFATVKGGGHTAPEYKPRECLAMLTRWISHRPL